MGINLDKHAMTPVRQDILGVSVNVIDLEDAVRIISGWVEAGRRERVCVVPAHTVMDALEDSSLRMIINQSGLVTPDGMSIVWALKLFGRSGVGRVYGPDLMLACCRFGAARGWKHFFLGSTAEVLESLENSLREDIPGLQIAGKYAPPFREKPSLESSEVIEKINRADPDLVWVGLGAPKQEYWIQEHRGELHASVMIGVGAAFDFLSGNKSQAPRWIQRAGLEWLYRFIQEPRRLWARYSQYPRFVVLLVGQLLGLYHPGE
jgi:N-acetylglucosaminyldiphosphoundecaprenol N-acetyl-beta-D-mannosaminyltransferase